MHKLSIAYKLRYYILFLYNKLGAEEMCRVGVGGA